MQNPFAPKPKDESAVSPETMTRWKVMQTHIKDSTNLEKLQPVVQRLVGEKIENQWQTWAKNSGQIFPETFKDSSGREVTRYSGDIKSAFQPWVQDPIKVRLPDLSHYKGQSFIKGQEPPHIQRAMLLERNGFSSE